MDDTEEYDDCSWQEMYLLYSCYDQLTYQNQAIA